jgi:hypothetical protein
VEEILHPAIIPAERIGSPADDGLVQILMGAEAGLIIILIEKQFSFLSRRTHVLSCPLFARIWNIDAG